MKIANSKINPIGFVRLGLGMVLVSLGMGVAYAEEVPPGYVVNKANLSATDKQTFEGHNLGAMITPVMRKMIELNLTLTLANTKPVINALPLMYAATEKYSGNVKYDRATRRISGYVAGIPFPNLSDTDPDLADKIIWNTFYSALPLTDITFSTTKTYAIDAIKGVQREAELVNSTLKLNHRTSIEPIAPKAIGDGKIHQKLLVFNLAPQDISGTGAYIQRYEDGRGDDSWAYVKSIRRVRRGSGGTWMNPIPGTDLANDESACFSAFPTWYPKYTYIGKQWVLGVMNGKAGVGSPPLALVDTKTPPYWNPIKQPWEPREVYVVDIATPEEHPSSRRRIYYGIKDNVILMCEMYDKKGSLWKFFPLTYAPTLLSDGQIGLGIPFAEIFDLQRMHATYVDTQYRHSNDARANPDDWAPETLADSVKFSIPVLKQKYGPADWFEALDPTEIARRKAQAKR